MTVPCYRDVGRFCYTKMKKYPKPIDKCAITRYNKSKRLAKTNHKTK